MPEKYRIVVAKPGLDGHDRGAKVVARALRDAGFEVIYTGLHQTPEQIAETAIQEDADGVGLSCHSGAHMTLFPKVVKLLRERGAGDVVVFGGGIIPKDDIPKLQAEGIERIFTPGAATGEIVAWLRERLGGKVAVKVQVQIGGRGKGGGIALVGSPEEAEAAAARMFSEGFRGTRVTRVLVERLVEISEQFYAAISLDRSVGAYLAIVSSEGGMDIEEVARERPAALRRVRVDPLVGMRSEERRVG